MNIGDPQSFNRYAYVSGDPVNFIDPSGLIEGPPCEGGRPVFNSNGIGIGWICPVTRTYGPGGGGGGGRPPIVDSGGGRGGGGVADRTFDSDENGDDQEKIEECARKAMRNARRNVPSLAARQHTGVLATLAGGYILLRSGPGALLLLGPRRSSFRITRIKPEGNKAIAASAVGTLGSALSGSMLWDALKDSLGVMSAIDQCRKEHPNGQLSHATLARLALSIF